MDFVKANILIDETARARLTDFGLLAIISDTSSRVSSSSIIQGGTYRWMSPELFYPESFGLKDSRPTKYSDCYALGMVIYEVLSGQVPFPRHNVCAIVAKVSRGERPGRPRGAGGRWFTDSVWRMLQRCWAPKPDHRPRIEDIFRRLEETSRFWKPLPSHVVANSPTPGSPTRDFSYKNVEASTKDSKAPCPSHVATTSHFVPLFHSVAFSPRPSPLIRGGSGPSTTTKPHPRPSKLAQRPAGMRSPQSAQIPRDPPETSNLY